MAQIFIKDPDAVLDYIIDWSDDSNPWLATDETISSYTITAETGITKDSDNESDGAVTIWLSGGTAGENYTVACRIVTNAGRTDERTIIINCRNQ